MRTSKERRVQCTTYPVQIASVALLSLRQAARSMPCPVINCIQVSTISVLKPFYCRFDRPEEQRDNRPTMLTAAHFNFT